MSGLTSTGFESKDLDTILTELAQEERSNIRSDYNTSSTSVGGILNGIFGAKLLELWEVAAAVYASLSRETAVGQQLDNIGALTGVLRQPAVASSATQAFTGTAGTLIPAGSVVSDPATPTKKFVLDDDVTLDGSGEGEGTVTATVTGATVANAGTLTKIDTPIAGWSTTTNLLDAELGRDIETDENYRARQLRTLALSGEQSYVALRSALLNLSGVSNANVYANESSVVVDGAPPHSVEAVVEGGDDQAIFDLLAQKVGMGISTYGNTTGTVTDSEGNVYTMKFSRPVQTDIELSVTLEKDPATYIGDAAWKQALSSYVNALLPGKEVVTSKMEGLGVNLGGVTDTTSFQIALLGDPLGTANVPMTRRQVARLEVANIDLTSTDET